MTIDPSLRSLVDKLIAKEQRGKIRVRAILPLPDQYQYFVVWEYLDYKGEWQKAISYRAGLQTVLEELLRV